jgi:hypothetical protein
MRDLSNYYQYPAKYRAKRAAWVHQEDRLHQHQETALLVGEFRAGDARLRRGDCRWEANGPRRRSYPGRRKWRLEQKKLLRSHTGLLGQNLDAACLHRCSGRVPGLRALACGGNRTSTADTKPTTAAPTGSPLPPSRSVGDDSAASHRAPLHQAGWCLRTRLFL